MSPSNVVRIHIFEAKLADVQNLVPAVFLWVWSGVPGVDLPASELNAFDFARGSGHLGRLCRF